MSEAQPQGVAEQTLCAMCEATGTFRCTGCRDIKYCSKQCQKSDWPIHKIICKSLKNFSEDQRSDHNHKRAIRFPQNGEQPHFFWLRYAARYSPHVDNGAGGMETVPALGALLGVADTVYNGGTIDVFRSVTLDPLLETRFSIIGKFREVDCQDDAPVPANEINKSLLKIDRELQDSWYGEIIAYRLQPNNEISRDLGALEFRHAVDTIRMRYDEAQREREKRVQGPPVQGVRFANISDVQHSHCETIEDLPISAALCTAESAMETPICDRIGIPLVVHRLPLSVTGRDWLTGANGRACLGMIPALHYLNPLLSFADPRHGIGSAFVVRKDGRPLNYVHMTAILAYSKHLYLQHEAYSGSEIWTPADLDVCNKEHFMAWWQNWHALKEVEGDVLSPYEV